MSREREREHNIMQVGVAGELKHRTKSGLPVLGGGGRCLSTLIISLHFRLLSHNLMDTEWFSWPAGPQRRSD